MSSTPEGTTTSFPTREELYFKARALQKLALQKPYTKKLAHAIYTHLVRRLADPHEIILPKAAHVLESLLSKAEIEVALLHASNGKSASLPEVPVLGPTELINVPIEVAQANMD